MDQINRVIYRSDDAEQMLWTVLETAFSIFGCDRIWLFYPCDPTAPTYRIPVEVTRPEYTGAHALTLDVPMQPGGDKICTKALATPGPVLFGADTDPPIFKELTDQFGVRSQMAMAIYPKVGKPWMLGMHQCGHARVWTGEEQRLFEGIARRIGDGLSTLLLLRNLRESQERFDLAVKGSRDGLWDWPDTKQQAMWWSPRVYEMFGYKPGELTPSGSLLTELAHPEDRERVKMALREHLQGGEKPFDEQFRLISQAGQELWIWARGMSIRDAEGQARRMSGSFQDITERKRAERELATYRDQLEQRVEERTVELKAANVQLKVANKELEAFSYTVSHDLRTPLTPIIGYAEFLRNQYADVLDSQAIDILTEIETQGEKMLALMENLLTLAQLGHIKGPAEPESAEEVLQEVLHSLADEFPAAAQLVAQPGRLPAVRIPRTLLVQLFTNLIGNALRYAGKQRSPIEVSGERRGERVRFTIRDHGPGIPAQEQLRVFEVFYRGSTGKGNPGTGVGLAIVAKIARCYGGKAWLETTPGGGASFHVEVVETPDQASSC